MSVTKKLTSIQLYNLLCKKFPHINATEGEDLSIHNAKLNIVTRCWNDLENFPTVKEISDATGFSSRNLHNFVRDNNFKQRKPRKNGKLIRLPAALQPL